MQNRAPSAVKTVREIKDSNREKLIASLELFSGKQEYYGCWTQGVETS